jgi:Ca2+-binding RTX toxin-like protein
MVDLSSSTHQVVSIDGNPVGLTQRNFENVDASGLVGGPVTVIGSDGDNIIILPIHGNGVQAGGGNDTIVIPPDHGYGCVLWGDAGDDLFLIGTMSLLSISGGTGTDILRYTGTTATTLDLESTAQLEQIEVANSTGDFSGTAAINVNAINVRNGLTISGNNGTNVLTGTTLADTLIGHAGNDTLRGGLGNDTYQINRGDGPDRISDIDGTPGNSDQLLYGSTINPLDLVLSRQVNDLRIAVHGSLDHVTIQNWYTSQTANQIETIQAGNGQHLLNTQVDQLISAMAQFTTDTGLSWDAAAGGAGTAQQQAQFQGILAASWQ